MDLSYVTPCPTTPQKIVALFCIVWPFLAMASTSRRGRSSAPWSALMVALAVVLCGLWVDLARVEFAEEEIRHAFSATAVALWPAAWIAVYSLALRHRPTVDSFVILHAAILGLHLFAAFLFASMLAPSDSLVVFARGAAAVTLVTAVTAALRLFVTT